MIKMGIEIAKQMLVINIFAFIMILILNITYFSKERVKKVEHKIFSYSLLSSLAVSFLGILFGFISLFFDEVNFLVILFAKLYSCSLIVNVFLFTVYVYAIGNKKMSNFDNYLKYSMFFIVIVGILLLLIPIDVKINDYVIEVGGALSKVCYFLYSFALFIQFILAIVNYKDLLTKKYIPLICLILFSIFFVILQSLFLNLNYLNSILGIIVSFLMYFTIENPDVKMIEQLNKARDEAVKANQAKTDFLSSMSHEIRTPLNAICGFSNSLLENDGVSSEAKDDVKNIIMASDTLLELVNGILDISKIEANKLEIIDSVYSFKKMYEELILLTKARIGEKPIDFRYNYDESIPEYLYGDGVRVKQIIINLLTNSAKYTKDGYIDFKIDSIKKDNIIRLIISVEDSGIGIKKESVDKLFTKFERLGVEKQTTTEGTGLGLAITKKLVEMMGGKIVVQSIYGKGSIFTISIDQKMLSEEELSKVKKENESEEKTNEIIDATGKSILVVDDNLLNLKVAERLLKVYKCNITFASSGSECLDKVSNNKYDLILLDDMMPRMSGTETLQKLKEIDSFNTPVVALTANAITGMREEYINRGFNDYLSKPIVKEDLNRVMKKYLKK
ncbi:MAG: ATP-binding protein [Tenericutes bacterium]|nr:ATP-binding protein [Mycoplasmatota bacterium]